MQQTQSPKAGERHAITSVTIGDGIGGGAGTVITKEGKSLLEIWREGEVQKVPLTMAAAAPDLLEACRIIVEYSEALQNIGIHPDRINKACDAFTKAGGEITNLANHHPNCRCSDCLIQPRIESR